MCKVSLTYTDSYRQFTGPANVAGKRVISNEMGAQIFQAYQQTLPELLDLTKRAYSAGNNQMVFHGSPYSWQYPNTTVSPWFLKCADICMDVMAKTCGNTGVSACRVRYPKADIQSKN